MSLNLLFWGIHVWSSHCPHNVGVGGSVWMWHCKQVVIWSGCWRGDELVALSEHIIVIADPHMVGFEMTIHRFDVSTLGEKVGGVWNTDSKHCASISLLFLAYRATVHVSGFVRALNGMSTLQHWPFPWGHVEYCCSVITTVCVQSCNSYVFVIDFIPCWHITMWHW